MRIVSLIAAIALTIGLAAWYLDAEDVTVREKNAPAGNAVPAPSESFDVGEPGSSALPPPVVAQLPAVARAPDYAAQYRVSGDLLSFIEGVAPAAAEGDVDALYYLAVASRRCTREYEGLFGPPGKEMTLDVALEKNYWTKYYEQLARKIYGQCQRFKAVAANPFSEWQNLLDAAADAGSGSAKALLAFEMQNGMIRIDDPTTRARMSGVMRDLAKEAIRSKEPEAIYYLAYVESVTGRSGTPEDVAGAWMLAACQRGMECGSSTEHFQFFCRWDPECQASETLVDLFRRRPRFDELQRLATELNARLDEERFEEIIP